MHSKSVSAPLARSLARALAPRTGPLFPRGLVAAARLPRCGCGAGARPVGRPRDPQWPALCKDPYCAAWTSQHVGAQPGGVLAAARTERESVDAARRLKRWIARHRAVRDTAAPRLLCVLNGAQYAAMPCAALLFFFRLRFAFVRCAQRAWGDEPSEHQRGASPQESGSVHAHSFVPSPVSVAPTVPLPCKLGPTCEADRASALSADRVAASQFARALRPQHNAAHSSQDATKERTQHGAGPASPARSAHAGPRGRRRRFRHASSASRRSRRRRLLALPSACFSCGACPSQQSQRSGRGRHPVVVADLQRGGAGRHPRARSGGDTERPGPATSTHSGSSTSANASTAASRAPATHHGCAWTASRIRQHREQQCQQQQRGIPQQQHRCARQLGRHNRPPRARLGFSCSLVVAASIACSAPAQFAAARRSAPRSACHASHRQHHIRSRGRSQPTLSKGIQRWQWRQCRRIRQRIRQHECHIQSRQWRSHAARWPWVRGRVGAQLRWEELLVFQQRQFGEQCAKQ